MNVLVILILSESYYWVWTLIELNLILKSLDYHLMVLLY